MLDSETKRRIDTCRNILVGKVPDPKSQVEQITVSLIYKFMDDMDLQSEEMGGKRKFFTGDFERYRWAKLVAPGVSGQDMLNTYSEALTKMVENDKLPALFRSIFRNAYLPYRDPETLRSFLREINAFTYDHSEKLGDAFEYLLSVLGSQGDAGQFRTPRHIIDFMVDIIAPKKDEVILDPACGTAGFLISAYKHILKANSTNAAPENGKVEGMDAAELALESPMRFSGDLLSARERERLARNIKGYDISPDMVRLSLVNLYLHGFADPKVEEYDTLTSEDKWTEMADVILANPPFMSPKGGIKPHTRFKVESKRSEVLFVDYMAEHLTPNGRAAIVVPEGIIFQSQTSYVQLRQMLVENFLAAVISLPAGVFNPYSGVKTSILILDRAVAKACDHVAFFKIENDGFALGAQRRAVKGSQLPQVKAELAAWLDTARTGGGEPLESPLGFAVSREQIAENGEFNLSGGRYSEGDVRRSQYPVVTLGEVAEVIAGQSPEGKTVNDLHEGIPFHQGKTDFGVRWILPPRKWTVAPTKIAEPNDILMSVRAPVGPVNLTDYRMCIGRGLAAIRPSERIDGLFLFQILRSSEDRIVGQSGAAFEAINRREVEAIPVPLPPLDFQREIVAEIEGYQRVIDGARAVIENYRPHVPVDPDWPTVPIGDVCSMGGRITTDLDLSKPYFGADSFEANTGRLLKIETADAQRVNGPVYEFNGRRILYSKIRPYLNKLTIIETDAYCSSDMYPLEVDEQQADITFIAKTLLGDRFQQSIRGFYDRASIPKINRDQLFGTEIALPPLEVQQALAAEIEAEQALVDGNRDLITRFEQKIDAAIARVWGESKAEAT